MRDSLALLLIATFWLYFSQEINNHLVWLIGGIVFAVMAVIVWLYPIFKRP
jgi:putative Ca2+/H+ antiporter (TMEM165/GDT1 family)